MPKSSPPTKRAPRLTAKWSKRQKDIVFDWDFGVSHHSPGMLNEFFFHVTCSSGKTLIEELKERGFDIETLRFKIHKMKKTP